MGKEPLQVQEAKVQKGNHLLCVLRCSKEVALGEPARPFNLPSNTAIAGCFLCSLLEGREGDVDMNDQVSSLLSWRDGG